MQNMADTQRVEKSDYFGHNWNSGSPNRAQGVRSPGPGYAQDYGRAHIRPGANNSFGTNSSPIRGLRQTHNPSSPDISGRPPRRPSQDRFDRVRSPSDMVRPPSSGGHHHEERPRRRRAPSQKAMLSEALQKANHAVVLDNAQNFEGAVQAYYDACALLEQVMHRSSGGDDWKKLEAIRNTYRNRINELETTELVGRTASTNKALPDVPVSPYVDQRAQYAPAPPEDDEEPVVEDATALYMERDEKPAGTHISPSDDKDQSMQGNRQSFKLSPLPSLQFDKDNAIELAAEELTAEWRHELDSSPNPLVSSNLTAPMDSEYMPQPLSPRPPTSPQPQEPETEDTNTQIQPRPTPSGHQSLATMESTSWLDTIEESGGSSNSSSHSRTSSIGILRRKHLRTQSGDTEAEFDAALDAAVEAAYDDGYEPMIEEETVQMPDARTSTILKTVRMNVDLAKQRARDAEREDAILAARERETQRVMKRDSLDQTFEDAEAEEEERMLEEMTKNYILDQRDLNSQPKGFPPRQSDSSTFSGRTLGSSVGSTLTAGTSLSTVNEMTPMPVTATQARPPLAPPPTGALPPPPITRNEGILPSSRFVPGASPRTSASGIVSPGVRERRLSGQRAKELTINTAVKLPSGLTGPKTQPVLGLPLPLAPASNTLEPPRSATLAMELTEEPEEAFLTPMGDFPDSAKSQPVSGSATVAQTAPVLAAPSPSAPPPPAPAPAPLAIVTAPQTFEVEEPVAASGSPAKPKPMLTGLRKNFSASSLRSLTRHGGGTPATEESPSTPITRIFSAGSIVTRSETLPTMPDLPLNNVASFSKGNAVGLSFLVDDIHSPRTPGSPNPTTTNPPVPLEPCPESFLLRPFWLMRALYQTIAHPRGGYISTRLFVPRDTWRVVNVKLKNVEDKVANCDLLTAALMNLTKVDTLDADALLEEMQAFELILDQVQGQLNKKLGAEVGVHGSASLFRSPPIGSDEGASSDGTTRSTSISSKSYLSWKRLRSKNSTGPGLPLATSTVPKSESRDFLTMRSLPMTTSSNPRFAKRDPTKVLGIGPHSHYMASLGRLCDAVQILDQIARQVEDPGLRLSSQTHVGLELCIRHAAEFFAFFICRFALSDIGMMLDKFVKRGSEWVLA